MNSLSSMMLVLGTTNAGKQKELAALLEPFHIECRSLKDFASAVHVAETGSTFADNAALKAVQQAKALNHWVLAEDSGLVVEALDGSPGVYSARFAGPEASDEDNNALLIKQLARVPTSHRVAYYACHATLAAPDGTIKAIAEGRCYGRIAKSAHGTEGFGYDPYFIIPEYHQTFGELSPAVKGLISHRGRAIRAIIPMIVSSFNIHSA
ncbi:MAG TPA: non-canonical purine NTP pyrophosphatase, RdgB/HAM1 family [Planctomycetaceae bacterium]|nr:non-canonical purine NTP pyrophosphatase, RdgB/HAM1 family [Planctomycetaceae bacterium]